MKRSIVLMAALMAAFALGACKKKEAPPPPPPTPAAAAPQAAPAPAAAPAPTPTPAAVAPAAPAPSGPKWVQALPQRAPTAKVGDVVWAMVPRPNEEYSKAFGAMKVEAVTGNSVTLAGDFNAKHEGVPAAVLQPVAQGPSTLKVGDIATLVKFGSPSLGIVTKVDGRKVTLKHDFAGGLSETTTEDAFALVAGVAPHAWVHHKGQGANTSRYKGFVVAVEGDKAWVLTGSGLVEITEKADAKPLTFKTAYKVGQKVIGYIPAYSDVTISKVIKPGFQYEALWKVGGKDVPKKFFFHDLLEQL